MRGLLADVNIQGHTVYLRHMLEHLDLWSVLADIKVQFANFQDLAIAPELDDRSLWNYCQAHGWVLFTENRNQDGPNSLQATLADSWQPGNLPILTLANKGKLEHSRAYAERVANDVAELLFGINHGEYLDQARIFVPRLP